MLLRTHRCPISFRTLVGVGPRRMRSLINGAPRFVARFLRAPHVSYTRPPASTLYPSNIVHLEYVPRRTLPTLFVSGPVETAAIINNQNSINSKAAALRRTSLGRRVSGGGLNLRALAVRAPNESTGHRVGTTCAAVAICTHARFPLPTDRPGIPYPRYPRGSCLV